MVCFKSNTWSASCNALCVQRPCSNLCCNAAKGAVEGLAKSLAAEWAPLIRVNVIAPSLTDTPLAGALLNSDLKKEAAAKRHPLQQVGRSEDIATLVAHLLSGHSRFMTGQVLHVDGGLSSVRTF